MTSRVIGRLGALTVVLMLGAGMLVASPAGADQTPWFGPARLINTTRIVGFPQHFVLTAQQNAGRGGNPGPGGGGFGGGGGGGFGGSTAPRITSQPSSESVTAGATASFSAAASGSPTPSVQWDVSTNGGSTWSPASGAGATSTTYSFAASSPQNGNEYKAVFTNSLGTATTSAATLTVTVAPPPPPPPPPGVQKSSNWSGYADVGTTFSVVSASWTVPTITCQGSATSYSAHWIGIDGYSSSTVEQDGTEADCLNGSPTYDAWYEMYGDSNVNSGYEVQLSYPVSPGDSITASVSASGINWTLSIADSSRGWSYNTSPISFQAAQSSAEWVVERPEVCSRSCSLTSLADFGSVTFTGASATSGSPGPISAYSNAAIEMVSGSTLLAVPSALAAGGASFIDTWKAL